MDEAQPNLPAEVETGNIEYKRHLHINPADHFRLTKLTTQMMYRLNQGFEINKIFHAVYYIGVEDDGKISGQNVEQVGRSIKTLSTMIENCEAEVSETALYKTEKGCYAKVNIIKTCQEVKKEEFHIGFLGPSASGKSTLIGVLSHGFLDNGNGSARSSVLRFDHEKKIGTTSSIKQEFIGYKGGQRLDQKANPIGSRYNLVKNSDRLITLVDLPGSIDYLKTILYGLTAHNLDLIFLVFDSNKTDPKEVKFFGDLCQDLGVPIAVILTKIDLNRLSPEIIFEQLQTDVPVFQISSSTGEGFLELHQFLGEYSFPVKPLLDHGTLFLIHQVYYVPDVGTVVAGEVRSGKLSVGDKLLVGPYQTSFHGVKILSIHTKQVPCKSLDVGQYGSCLIEYDPALMINKHLSIISEDSLDLFVSSFTIQIHIVHHDLFRIGQNLIINTNNVKDKVVIIDIIQDKETINLRVIFEKDHIKLIESGQIVILRVNEIIIVGRCGLDLQRDPQPLSDEDHA